MAPVNRRFFIVGNFKMNGTRETLNEIITDLNAVSVPDCDVLVAPPACYLQHCQDNIHSQVQVCAQNCYKYERGAYTGEISPGMIRDLGINWVMLGHNERRHIFNEEELVISQKTKHALKCGLRVVFCVGENAEDRHFRRTEKVIFSQMKYLKGCVENWSRVVVAYEPLWAMGGGNGEQCSAFEAQTVHKKLRQWVYDNVGLQTSYDIRIIYGGSVDHKNCKELAKQKDIDGFLVGGATLRPEFFDIVRVPKFKK